MILLLYQHCDTVFKIKFTCLYFLKLYKILPKLLSDWFETYVVLLELLYYLNKLNLLQERNLYFQFKIVKLNRNKNEIFSLQDQQFESNEYWFCDWPEAFVIENVTWFGANSINLCNWKCCMIWIWGQSFTDHTYIKAVN